MFTISDSALSIAAKLLKLSAQRCLWTLLLISYAHNMHTTKLFKSCIVSHKVLVKSSIWRFIWLPEISVSRATINGYDTEITLTNSVRACQMRKISERLVKIDVILAEIFNKQ